MKIFVTGSTRALGDARQAGIVGLQGVTCGWVDPEERGRGIYQNVIPDEAFDVMIFLIDETCLGSTQMAVHFSEARDRVRAERGLLVAFVDSLGPEQFSSELASWAPCEIVEPDSLLDLIDARTAGNRERNRDGGQL